MQQNLEIKYALFTAAGVCICSGMAKLCAMDLNVCDFYLWESAWFLDDTIFYSHCNIW
jgi:hypothetical protein